MSTRNCFLILMLITGLSLFAQEVGPIQFTSGNLFPVAGRNDFQEPLQQKKLNYGNRYYFLLQFQQMPDEAQKDSIENVYNLRFCSYLPSNTFYCVSEKPIPSADFLRFGIYALLALEEKQKTDPALLSILATHTTGQPVKLVLSLFEPERVAEFRLRLQRLGYAVDFTTTYKPLIRIELNDTQLTSLAALPFISYIEAAPDAPYALNRFANTNHRDNVLNFSGPGGRNLQGDSVIIGEGDDGYIQPHLDHTPRLTNFYIPQNSDHPEHVAGTIAGAGNINPTYRGMAPKAKILADYFNAIQDDVPSFYPAYNMVLTSNSWGSTSGCSSKGIYTSSSASIDQQMRDYTKVLHVFAASNDGGNNCAPYTAGYHTIGSNENCAKNVLTVGALTSADVIASFSSRGPCNDGRIKPEVSAVGVSVTSTVRTNTYSVKSGTSMATPGTSGTIALLIQRYRQLHGNADADAALYKAILANTADDQGTAGPDYYYGFGRINARKAVECMEANRYFEGSASQSDSVSYSITVPSGASLLKVMLYWCDKDGNPAATYSLVNNLDLKVYDPLSNLNKPLVLDYTPANCSLAAVQRTDTLNNIEQVSISSPASGSYLLVVRGTSVPFGPQNFKLVYDYYSPAVVLTYPVGNEKLISGGTETIYWDNTGITSGTFTLSYSTDSGATYTNIVTGLSSSTKSYAWTLPVVNSSACYVKITHSGGLYKDSCEADFTIAARPVTFAVNVCDRKARLSWAPVSGASAYRIYLIDTNLSGNILTLQDVTGSSCHISPLVNGKDYWFSVAAVFPTGYVSERAIALKATPSATACNDANDVGITYIASPVSGRANTSSALSATQVITVTIRNFSAGSISSIPVSYQVNGGATVTETYGGSIGANSTASFSFATTADFSALGTYTVKCFTGYASDATPADDTLRVTVRHLANDTVSLPYLEDMELCTQGILLGNYIGANGMDRADFTTNTTTGRVRFAAGTGYTSSGIHSAVLDKSPTDATMTTNYLTYTFNLSHLTGTAYNPSLTFSFTQFGEESNAADSVWIRGADTQPFIPVYSLYANRPAAGVFKKSSVLDLKTLLAAQGQSLTSSFQVRFGQQDDSAAIQQHRT